MLPPRARRRSAVWLTCGVLFCLAATWESAASAARGSARSPARGSAGVQEAQGLTVDGRPVGAGVAIAAGQRLAVAPGGEALVSLGDAAFKVFGASTVRVISLAPRLDLALETGAVMALSGRNREVQATTVHARAAARQGTFFMRDAGGAATYVCACGGHVRVGERTGPLTDLPRPNHVSVEVGGVGFKLVPVDHHGGQDLWDLVLALEPTTGEAMRQALWTAISKPPARLAQAAAPRTGAPAPEPREQPVSSPAPRTTPKPPKGQSPAPVTAPPHGSVAATAPATAPAHSPRPATPRQAQAQRPASRTTTSTATSTATRTSPATASATTRRTGSVTATTTAAATASEVAAFPPPHRTPAPTPTPRKGESPPPDLEKLFPDIDPGAPGGP